MNYSEVRLTWVDNSANETRFEIARMSGGNSVTISVGANLTSYTDSGLSPETPYTYQIRACNSAFSSDFSASTSAKTLTWSVAIASYVGTDTITKGNWIGKYGSEGFDIVGFKRPLSYGTITPVDCQIANPWHTGTLDNRDLQTPEVTSRFSACYFKAGEFYFDVNLGGGTHRVSLYCIDRDNLGRKQDITIVDAKDGTALNTFSLESFGTGKYLTWDISGHVLIKVKWVNDAGPNAVVSGIFFDAPGPIPPPPPVAPDGLNATAVSKSQINLTWSDKSDNESGFKIERSKSSSTGFSEIGSVGPNVTAYSSAGLTRSTTYYYRIRAYNSAGESGYSTASATTLAR